MLIQFTLGGTKYAINADGVTYNAICYSTNQDKKSSNYGKETEKILGYCTSFVSAASKCLKEEIGSNPDKVTLEEYCKRIEALNNELKEQLKMVEV